MPSKSPLPLGTKYFYLGGQDIRSPDQLVGRSSVLEQIQENLERDRERTFICLWGIGGIG